MGFYRSVSHFLLHALRSLRRHDRSKLCRLRALLFVPRYRPEILSLAEMGGPVDDAEVDNDIEGQSRNGDVQKDDVITPLVDTQRHTPSF